MARRRSVRPGGSAVVGDDLPARARELAVGVALERGRLDGDGVPVLGEERAQRALDLVAGLDPEELLDAGGDLLAQQGGQVAELDVALGAAGDAGGDLLRVRGPARESAA